MAKQKWYHNVYLRSRLWVPVRADYMRRVGWTCERCFIRATVVHHLDYSRLGYEKPAGLALELEALVEPRARVGLRHRDWRHLETLPGRILLDMSHAINRADDLD